MALRSIGAPPHGGPAGVPRPRRCQVPSLHGPLHRVPCVGPDLGAQCDMRQTADLVIPCRCRRARSRCHQLRSLHTILAQLCLRGFTGAASKGCIQSRCLCLAVARAGQPLVNQGRQSCSAAGHTRIHHVIHAGSSQTQLGCCVQGTSTRRHGTATTTTTAMTPR